MRLLPHATVAVSQKDNCLRLCGGAVLCLHVCRLSEPHTQIMQPQAYIFDLDGLILDTGVCSVHQHP